MSDSTTRATAACGATLSDPVAESVTHVCSRVDDHIRSPKGRHWDHSTDMTWPVAAEPLLPPDPYTMSLRMCDDDGMVSNERCDPQPAVNFNLTYLEMHNNMRVSNSYGGCSLITEPFACTGSAHMSGEHILCTSPAHKGRAMWSEEPGTYVEADGTTITTRGTVE